MQKQMNGSSDLKKVSQSKSVESFSGKIKSAIDLVKEAKDQKINEAAGEMQEAVDHTMEKLQSIKEKTFETVENSTSTLRKSVKERPFQYMAGAALLGVVLGFLLRKK